MDIVSCPKPKLNKFLIVNPKSLHARFGFRLRDPTSRFFGFRACRVQYPCLIFSFSFNENVQDAARHLCHVRCCMSLVMEGYSFMEII